MLLKRKYNSSFYNENLLKSLALRSRMGIRVKYTSNRTVWKIQSWKLAIAERKIPPLQVSFTARDGCFAREREDTRGYIYR